jgi:heme-degrading monooxygenase HmoA
MYVIVWKYKVKPSDKVQFESEYGHGGIWVSFFKESEGYVGSKLYSGKDDYYLLIDAWDSRESHDHFLKEKYDHYHRLSDQYRYLYEEEICIGDFHELNAAMTTIL